VQFPAGFRWGAAASAYQIEGAVGEDGRGQSIWDTFSHTPGKVAGGDTGDVACDHYHRYADDVALMARLGLQAYRFSVAWPRVQPDGRGPANPAGLDFYDRLVNELISHGIEPMLTLYHWDLPQPLEDAGGWPERETAHRFAEYAALVYGRLGDRVRTWITINEPGWPAFLGYGAGGHAPGRTDPAAAFTAAHHLLLGHGEAARALRALGAESVGIAHDPPSVRPADPANPADVAGARIIDALRTRVVLDPVTGKGYPAEVLALAERHVGTGWLREGDEQTIGAGIDLLGVNYYQPTVIAARPGESGDPAFPGTEGLAWVQPPGPVTTMGWVSEPASLTDLLVRLARDYPGIPLWVTENGAAYDDKPNGDGNRVADPDRVAYLDGHVRAVHAAVARGIDVRGYLVWSLMDNFEWAEGYRQRFGLIYVDYQTQARILKDSAHWYHQLITTGELSD
jgi:beta-glucosidase